MAVINSTQPLAFFRSIGRWLQIWMDVIAAKPGSRLTGADGVTGPWHDLGIAESEVRTLAGRWPDSAATLSGRPAGFGFDEETSLIELLPSARH
jgi:hypothetical protein